MTTTPAPAPAFDPGALIKGWIAKLQGPPSNDAKVLAAQQQMLKTFENSPLTKFALSQMQRLPADQRAQWVEDAKAQAGVTDLNNDVSLDYQKGLADIAAARSAANTREMVARDTGKTGNLLQLIGANAGYDRDMRLIDAGEAEKIRQWQANENQLDRADRQSLANRGLIAGVLGNALKLGALAAIG